MDQQQSWAESEQVRYRVGSDEDCSLLSPIRRVLFTTQDGENRTGHWTAGGQVRRGGSGAVKASSQAKLQAGHLHEDAGCRSEEGLNRNCKAETGD